MAIVKTTSRSHIPVRFTDIKPGWTEGGSGGSRVTLVIEGAIQAESVVGIPEGHTIVMCYSSEASGKATKIGFSDDGVAFLGDDSMLMESLKLHKFYIPNGATHVHFEGTHASGTTYVNFVTG